MTHTLTHILTRILTHTLTHTPFHLPSPSLPPPSLPPSPQPPYHPQGGLIGKSLTNQVAAQGPEMCKQVAWLSARVQELVATTHGRTPQTLLGDFCHIVGVPEVHSSQFCA